MSNDTTQKEKKEKYELNPLSLGMLYFGFWLTLIVLPVEVTIWQIILAWFYFTLSVLSLIAVYVPWLRYQYNEKLKSILLPSFFEITMVVFVIGLITSFTGTKGIIRNIIGYVGFIWVVTYILILIRTISDERIGKIFGILASVVFFGYGIYLMAQANDEPHMITGIVSTLIGIVMGYISIKQPKCLWHELDITSKG